MGRHDLPRRVIGQHHQKMAVVTGFKLFCIDAYPGAHCPGHAVVTVEERAGVVRLKDTEPQVQCLECGRWLQVAMQWQLRAKRPPDAPDIGDPDNPRILTNVKQVLGL